MWVIYMRFVKNHHNACVFHHCIIKQEACLIMFAFGELFSNVFSTREWDRKEVFRCFLRECVWTRKEPKNNRTVGWGVGSIATVSKKCHKTNRKKARKAARTKSKQRREKKKQHGQRKKHQPGKATICNLQNVLNCRAKTT